MTAVLPIFARVRLIKMPASLTFSTDHTESTHCISSRSIQVSSYSIYLSNTIHDFLFTRGLRSHALNDVFHVSGQKVETTMTTKTTKTIVTTTEKTTKGKSKLFNGMPHN